MKISIHHQCTDFDTYRTARVRSLFNAESGADTRISAELPIEDRPWQLGVIVGPSGSGKTSIGRAIFGPRAMYAPRWPSDLAIVDAIAPQAGFESVTGALASVGLGTVPAWLRPFNALSNGERFRANLARLVCEAPARAVLDEFSSVVDRQIAQVGAGAFAKAWRRTAGRVVLLSCHYDILDWLQPDWVFDTATGRFQWGWLRPRPRIDVDLWQCNWQHWPVFEPHHYLTLPIMPCSSNYVATVKGQLVAHVAFSTRPGLVEARACRLVVMPEWQGAGVGLRFLDAIAQRWFQGDNRFGKPMPTLFHTSHPGLAAALRRSPRWTQVSGVLYGGHKGKSAATIATSNGRAGKDGPSSGYGGHFRAVQGFRYLGGGCGMRIMIVGQQWLAEQLFHQARHAGHDVAGVVAPSSGDRLARAAAMDGVPCHIAPRRVHPAHVAAGLDLILCAHAHAFVPADVRTMARLGVLGYHPSLLPRHRGRDAIRWAIHMGEAQTGGSVFWLDDGADTGPIAAQDWCWIKPGDTPQELWRRELAPMGLRLFAQVLEQLGQGQRPATPQDDSLATWEPAFSARQLKDST